MTPPVSLPFSLTSRAPPTGSSSTTCSPCCAPRCRYERRPRGGGASPTAVLCPQNVLRKVQHLDALQISDVVMASLLRMFQSTAGSGVVQEDALMAVSTLVEGTLGRGDGGAEQEADAAAGLRLQFWAATSRSTWTPSSPSWESDSRTTPSTRWVALLWSGDLRPRPPPPVQV